MDILASLNPQQRLAVEHGRGPALVLAGAGSGKTRVIVHRIAYMIRNGAARPEHILAVTFTNKAAQEMRERVHALLGRGRTAEPLIATFHSFCVRVLRREIHRIGYKRDFSIYDTDDQRRLIKQILEEERRPEKETAPREILGRISFAKNHNIPAAVFAHRFPSADADLLQHLYTAYNDRLRRANALDFDDLLLKTVDVLERFPEVRDRCQEEYRFILVDEYQDTNRPQYDVLQLLAGKHQNVFVVGDEDQSIYKFRGANIRNILNFEKDFPGARIIKLEQNYRSTQTILDVAGAVVANNTERKGKTLWTDNARGDVVTCYRSHSARSEAEWIAAQIRTALREGPDSRLAILYRTNALSRNFEDVLMQYGIPFVVVGSVGFFNRMEVKDLLAYLRAAYNPEDDIALLRIINTPPRGIGGTTTELLTRNALDKGVPVCQALRESLQDTRLSVRAQRALARFHETLDGWIAKARDVSAGALLEEIIAQVGYHEMLKQRDSAQEAADRIANVDELVRAAYESGERGESALDFLDRASLSSELDQLDANARVALLTVHSAKGLEFDVVFLAGMEEGLFPHFQSRDAKEDLEEERRLCYVGMTRARRKLFLTWTPHRRRFGQDSETAALPSRFLKEVPAELVEGLELETPYTMMDKESEYGQEWHYGKAGRSADDAEQPRSLAELRTYLAKLQSGKHGAAAGGGRQLKTGMRVRHAQFGEGIILSRERTGNDYKLTIFFSLAGRKTLMEGYAKLQPL